MVFAIDFDHTICDSANVPEGRKLGPPLPGAKEALLALKEAGHEIVIHTCRANDGPRAIKIVEDWLVYFEIPFTYVWDEAGKVIADVYVDDRGFCFHGWEADLPAILAQAEYRKAHPKSKK